MHMTPSVRIVGLNVYPVKSFQGISLSQVQLAERGFVHDREWMVVDEQGLFVSQREEQRMALMSTSLTSTELVLNFPNIGRCHIPLHSEPEQSLEVRVWEDSCVAVDQGREVSDFLAHCFQRTLKLVRMSASTLRGVEAHHQALVKRQVSMHFGDSQPIHLVNMQSLQDLNSRLDQAVSANRFRANILVDGLEAYAEDRLRSCRIGQTQFVQSKTTSRCVITTIDQRSADSTQEPLRTLASYRSADNRVVFGSYLIHQQVGATLRVGDVVEDVEREPS